MMFFMPGWLLVAVIIAIGLVATFVLHRKDAAEPQLNDRPGVLVVGRFLSLVYAGLTLIGTAITVIGTLVGEAVAVTIPVQEFWPKPYPWVTLDPAPAASVVTGGFSTASVTVSGLGLDARLWLSAGHAVQGLSMIFIAIVVTLLCHRMLTGSPFRPVLAKATMAAALVISIGGLAWQILLGIGGSIASAQLLSISGWSAVLPTEKIADYVSTNFDTIGLPEWTVVVPFDFWPYLLGLVLAALALAFRKSERLQKDTEGLI